MRYTIIGICFALLWSSASVATKLGLQWGEPFIISNIRFFIAGLLMLFWAHLVQKKPLPTVSDWKPLFIYGVLNVALYLGLFVLAIQRISAGIGTLSLALNPLFISILSAFWLKSKISRNVIYGLVFGLLGIMTVAYPLLQNAHATPSGLALLFCSMLTYSVGTVYFSSRTWNLSLLVINGWQVLFGGIALLPFTLLFSNFSNNQWNIHLWSSILWLAIPVSIGAVQLWLHLLKIDTVRAALWLFVCPIIGFAYAAIILHEPLNIYTFVGTILVLLGLYLGKK
jgi:probable blue pigment (indigoidine) exporter